MRSWIVAVLVLVACKSERADNAPREHATPPPADAGSAAAPKRVLPPVRPATDVDRGASAELSGDTAAARALYKTACDAKVAGGCARLILLDRHSDQASALAKARALCSAGDGAGCFAVGLIVETGTFPHQPAAAEIIGAYDQGCSLGSIDACMELANVYLSGRSGATKDDAKGQATLTRACDLGEREACLRIGFSPYAK